MQTSLPNFTILTLIIEDPDPVTGNQTFSGTCTAITQETTQVGVATTK
jgi:hypothetical protein